LWSEVIRELIVRRTTDLNKKAKRNEEKKKREGINKKRNDKSTRTHTCRSGSTYRSFTRTIFFR
jgi:hypothetical protein